MSVDVLQWIKTGQDALRQTDRQIHTHARTHTRRHCRHIYIIEGKLSRWKRLDCLFMSLATDYWTVKFCFSIASYSVVKAATTVAIITTAVVVSATTRGAAAAVATWVLLPYIREGLGSARQKKKKKKKSYHACHVKMYANYGRGQMSVWRRECFLLLYFAIVCPPIFLSFLC